MNNEIYHHGIKGMKWGVRRTPAQLGHKPAKTKSESRDYRKEAKKMSDTELRSRINRMQMENQYVQLNRRQVNSGEKFAKEVVSGIAKGALIGVGTTYAKKGLEYLIKKGIK